MNILIFYFLSIFCGKQSMKCKKSRQLLEYVFSCLHIFSMSSRRKHLIEEFLVKLFAQIFVYASLMNAWLIAVFCFLYNEAFLWLVFPWKKSRLPLASFCRKHFICDIIDFSIILLQYHCDRVFVVFSRKKSSTAYMNVVNYIFATIRWMCGRGDLDAKLQHSTPRWNIIHTACAEEIQ